MSVEQILEDIIRSTFRDIANELQYREATKFCFFPRRLVTGGISVGKLVKVQCLIVSGFNNKMVFKEGWYRPKDFFVLKLQGKFDSVSKQDPLFDILFSEMPK